MEDFLFCMENSKEEEKILGRGKKIPQKGGKKSHRKEEELESWNPWMATETRFMAGGVA